jgi:hypothetical protein
VAVSGILAGSSLDIMAGTVDSSGLVFANGGQATVQAETLNLTGGEVSAAFEVTLAAAKAALSGGIISSGGEVIIDVSEELTDGGAADATTISSVYGIRILQKPPIADLSGVTVSTVVTNFGEAIHVWPGEDKGATRAGFENNLALKALVLSNSPLCTLTFRGTGAANALYVEKLDIADESLADLENVLNIEPSLTIYYASTSDNVPPEVLDGFITLGGGKLVYVREGGPGDEDRLVPVTLGDGRSATVPFRLRNSATVDSDNDGIPNALDLTPFDSVKVSQVKVSAGGNAVEILWNGLPGARYEVQASADLGATPWQTISTLQNSTASPQVLKADDPLAAGNTARIYRVIITP